MTPVDYTSYYKFVASLGLLLIGSGVALPLTISRTTISPASCKTNLCYAHHEMQMFILQAWIPISTIAIIGGLLLMVYGMHQWKQRQVVADQKEDAERTWAIQQASKEDLETKTRNEAEEIEESSRKNTEDDERRSLRNDPTQRSFETNPSTPSVPYRSSQSELRQTLINVERKVISTLTDNANRNQRAIVTGQVLRKGNGTRYIPDAIAYDLQLGNQNYLIEIKYSKEYRPQLFMNALFHMSTITRESDDLIPLVIYVTDLDMISSQRKDRARKALEQNVNFPCIVTILDKSRIEPEMRNLFERIPEKVTEPVLI